MVVFAAHDTVEYLKNRIKKLEADLRWKNDEVEVLKARIKYLEQFKPVEHEYCCKEVCNNETFRGN